MTPADIDRIRRSPVWRSQRMETVDTAGGRVLVKGQQPPRPTWGYSVLNGMARLISTRSAEEEVEDEIRDLKQRQSGGRST